VYVVLSVEPPDADGIELHSSVSDRRARSHASTATEPYTRATHRQLTLDL